MVPFGMRSRNRYRFILLILGSALLLSWIAQDSHNASAEIDEVWDDSLTATADTFISDRNGADIYGSASSLELGFSEEFGSERVLFLFDLENELPDNAKITVAQLQIYVEDADPELDPAMTVEVYEITEPWSEATTNWNNQPDIGSLRGSGTLERTRNFYPIDVTGLAQDWQQGDLENHGLMLVADANALNVRGRSLASRSVTPTVFRPRLTIAFDTDDTAPSVTVDPLAANSPAQFTVSWSGGDDEDGSGLDYVDVQVRINRGEWTDWITETTATSAIYTGQAGIFYEFRARGVDNLGNEESYGDTEASTLVGVPAATILPFSSSFAAGNPFEVRWESVDDTVGIVTAYDIYVSYNGRSWNLWLDGTTATSAMFTAGEGDGQYGFEAVALGDNGIKEPFTAVAEASIILDQSVPFVRPELYFPLMGNSGELN